MTVLIERFRLSESDAHSTAVKLHKASNGAAEMSRAKVTPSHPSDRNEVRQTKPVNVEIKGRNSDPIKGRESDPLIENKGAEFRRERGENQTAKGAEFRPPYKEEPSIRTVKEPSVRTNSYANATELVLVPKPKNTVHSQQQKAPQIDAEAIYRIYPRRVKKPKALGAIRRAVERIAKGQDKPDWWNGSPWPPQDPAAWLQERTAEYSRLRANEDQQYTPHPTTWFNESRYSDEYEIPKPRVTEQERRLQAGFDLQQEQGNAAVAEFMAGSMK
jgi:hypothetical protein